LFSSNGGYVSLVLRVPVSDGFNEHPLSEQLRPTIR